MNNSIIDDKEKEEQNENIKEIIEITSRLQSILYEIDKLTDENSPDLVNKFIQLHLVMGDIEWQYDQLHEIIRKVIKKIK